jgi:hypothetical protein
MKHIKNDYVGKMLLTAHDPDPDSWDYWTHPGEWVDTTCQEAEGIMTAHEDKVIYGSLADPDGDYGHPSIATEWGKPDRRTPLLASFHKTNPDESRECQHKKYVLKGTS